MASEFDLNNSTTTNFKNTVPDFIVEAKSLDVANGDGSETFVYYPEAPTMLGYLLSIPEIYSALSKMATWAFGAGWSSKDIQTTIDLKRVTGMGKDTFSQLIHNHEMMKLTIGDAFMEIVRKDNGGILNLIPISAERVKTVMKATMITRYEIWTGDKWVKKSINEILHSHNKRIGDNIRGFSQFAAATFAIDAKNEALADERVIKHRDKALGIVYYKTNNQGKMVFANSQIEKGVKDGEMIGFGEDTAKIEPYPSRSSEDRQAWIASLEIFIYQVLGVPRSVATSEGGEANGKMDNVNFEPTYAKERFDMEDDLWGQAAIQIDFQKQTQLGGLVKENEQKNTGQVAIQPNDVEASLTRE